MSGGKACQCGESHARLEVRRWRVLQRRCNHSAFNGYRYAPSDYSSLGCLECGARWRTKANYVYRLVDASVGFGRIN